MGHGAQSEGETQDPVPRTQETRPKTQDPRQKKSNKGFRGFKELYDPSSVKLRRAKPAIQKTRLWMVSLFQ